jgi:hypothetical protein
MTPTRIALVSVATVLLAGSASGGRPTPDASHPATGDVQWCDKGNVAAAVVVGPLIGATQGADYAGCKTGWESKGYVRLGSDAKLSPEDQRRSEEERERLNKALADSIRKN